jgi:ABC-type transport system involved in multi-copper enzyme maturation permease subunit
MLTIRLNSTLYAGYDVGFPVYSIRSTGSDIVANSILQNYGVPDATFVITSLFSLFGLFLGLETFAGERERKTLEMLLLSMRSSSAMLFGKFIAALSFPASCVLACSAVFSICLSLWFPISKSLIYLTALKFVLLGVTYVSVFVAIGMFVSLAAETLTVGLLKGLVVWVLLVYLMPVVVAAASEKIEDAPSANQIEAQIATVRTRNQNLANFEAASFSPKDKDAFVKLYRRYEGQTASYIYGREAQYQKDLKSQARFANVIEMTFPSSAFRLAVMRVTSTSFDDLFADREKILEFKRQFAQYVFDKRAADWKVGADVPVFRQSPPITHALPLREWTILLAEVALFLGLSYRRLSDLAT